MGLSRKRKSLPSRWLYDARGSELFESITHLSEYYPTVTEKSILRYRAADIAEFCQEGSTIVEYGAGSGIKTEILLDALANPAGYAAVDISGAYLGSTVRRLKREFPKLQAWPVVADFTAAFDLPPELPKERRVGFFPGSTLGNLEPSERSAFLTRMRDQLGVGGRAVVGVDLVKSLDRLLTAYDDSAGVTAAFNRNILERINRELGGSFPVERFGHEARWNPIERAVEMHLVSFDSRTVTVGGHQFLFDGGESIHTESSRKFDIKSINEFASQAGWRLDHVWTDSARLFAVIGLSARRISA